ncbi:MAG: deoxyribonuclease IV, partial [Clostridia bacterium]|nr:deoxyribonuclease IV [Clostridia bacterium]
GIRVLAEEMLVGDLKLMEHLPGNYYNFHPGSHVGQGVETGIDQIASMLNRVLYPELKTVVLLETMTGKGSEIGGKFEELREIIDRVDCKDRIGVCLDTCHVSDAGYDITNDLDGVVAEFDRVVGLNYLRAIHINDSMNPLGAKKDRHALIGEGHLGLETIVRVMTHPALKHLPFNLETPTDDEGHAKEIALLREKIGE